MQWTEIKVDTGSRVQLVDVTRRAADLLSDSKVKNGMCYLYVPHTTAGITINENADPDVVTDIIHGLEKIVPAAGSYRHAEGNSDAHIKASLMGFSCMVPVVGGRMALGTWQGIYFCEFDGPRRRKLLIGVSGDQ
ncbi:MAG TPA: secondary thiamine-phosphate synthase enzyme YjbQ [Methanocella sp.]|jgi:secondary thiamine-phosphate synthase enzyme